MAIRGRERTAWQDIYAIQQTTEMNHVPRYHLGGDIGILGTGSDNSAFFLMKLTDHPHFVPQNQSLEQELTVGLSQRRQDEYNMVASELATTTLNMQMHPWNLSLFLRGLFQEGSREVTIASDYIHQVSRPYWIPDVDSFMGATRVLDQAHSVHPHDYFVDPTGEIVDLTQDRTSHYMTGLVPTSIAISAEEGNIVQIAVECSGAHAGIMNFAGIVNKRTHNTHRLRVYPTPDQCGFTITDDCLMWHNGTPVGDVAFVNTENDFDIPTTNNVQVAIDTGAINFRPSDAVSWDGQYIYHNMYSGKLNNFTHPFDLLPDLKAPLLWQNATVKMRRMEAHTTNPWRSVWLPGFDLTMNNNLVGHFYNSPTVHKMLLGRFTAEGSVTIPWGTDKDDLSAVSPTFGGNDPLALFVNGVPCRIRVMWGFTDHTDVGDTYAYDPTTTTPGYHGVVPEDEGVVAIDQSIRHTDQTVEGENELGQAMTYVVVEDLGQAEDAAAANQNYPDQDRTRAIRISTSYTATELNRGQDAPIADWP